MGQGTCARWCPGRARQAELGTIIGRRKRTTERGQRCWRGWEPIWEMQCGSLGVGARILSAEAGPRWACPGASGREWSNPHSSARLKARKTALARLGPPSPTLIFSSGAWRVAGPEGGVPTTARWEGWAAGKCLAGIYMKNRACNGGGASLGSHLFFEDAGNGGRD